MIQNPKPHNPNDDEPHESALEIRQRIRAKYSPPPKSSSVPSQISIGIIFVLCFYLVHIYIIHNKFIYIRLPFN